MGGVNQQIYPKSARFELISSFVLASQSSFISINRNKRPIILYSIFLDNIARSLNFRCDFENGFFTCGLPEHTVLLIVKVKTQTGNHILVEDTEKQTEKFQPWKKLVKDGKQVPQKLPGILTPGKNDNSITSDSRPCPSLTEHEYKPRFFDESNWMNSDKENMPLTESVTPPSLRNLSLEEEVDDDNNEATSWEANVARKLVTTLGQVCHFWSRLAHLRTYNQTWTMTL